MSTLVRNVPTQEPARPSQLRHDGFSVTEVDPRTEPDWDAFVLAHPRALVYHHSAWLQALEREHGSAPICLACKDDAGRTRGVMPLLPTRGLPFHLGGAVTGRRLSSLPRTPVAGPLALDRSAELALVQAAIRGVRAWPGHTLQLKLASDELGGLVEGLAIVPWRLTYVLDLPECPTQLRIGGSRHQAHHVRWSVNKAARQGVQVRVAESEDELRAWYGLYLDSMRWHVVPPRPYRLFQACWEQLRPLGLMRLLLAEQHDSGRRALVAGSVFLMLGQTVCYAFNGWLRQGAALHANDTILWRAIHDASAEGFRHMDFGEVSADNAGLAEFKHKWGAEPRRLYHCYYPAPRAAEMDPYEIGRFGANRLLSELWHTVPLRATVPVGDWIYSRL